MYYTLYSLHVHVYVQCVVPVHVGLPWCVYIHVHVLYVYAWDWDASHMTTCDVIEPSFLSVCSHVWKGVVT